jgi:hypothetical protein
METSDEPRRRAAIGQVHLAHPRCPSCGRALYKALIPGTRVTRKQRYAWCRNAECQLFGRNIGDMVRIGGVLVDLSVQPDRAALAATLEGMS